MIRYVWYNMEEQKVQQSLSISRLHFNAIYYYIVRLFCAGARGDNSAVRSNRRDFRWHRNTKSTSSMNNRIEKKNSHFHGGKWIWEKKTDDSEQNKLVIRKSDRRQNLPSVPNRCLSSFLSPRFGWSWECIQYGKIRGRARKKEEKKNIFIFLLFFFVRTYF